VTADVHEHNVCGLGKGGGNSGQPRVDSRTQTRHSPPPDWCEGSEARGLHLHSDASVLHFWKVSTSKDQPTAAQHPEIAPTAATNLYLKTPSTYKSLFKSQLAPN
jgi:hypothetical protein